MVFTMTKLKYARIKYILFGENWEFKSRINIKKIQQHRNKKYNYK